MHWIELAQRGPIMRRLARDVAILLVLAAALTGFFLLLNLLVAQVAEGPRDLLAASPTDEEEFSLPSGVGLLAFGVIATSLAVGAAALFVPGSWNLRRGLPRPSLPKLIGVLVAILVVAAGLYLALSGTLGEEIDYEQHFAQRANLQPVGLAVLSVFFISVVVVGMLGARLLLPLLAAWLVAGAVFGFLDSRSLSGLYLFEHPTVLQRPVAYTAVVEEYLDTDIGDGLQADTLPEGTQEAESNGAPDPLDWSLASLASDTRFSYEDDAAAEPLFHVTGAAHTSFLRTATGDVYENGQWTQLDPAEIEVRPGVSALEEVRTLIAGRSAGQLAGLASQRANPDLLAAPSTVPDSTFVDEITVSVAGEFDSFQADVVPISLGLTEVSVEGVYRPFSTTFILTDNSPQYTWHAAVPQFSVVQTIDARIADDLTYLQLPEELPDRVRSLAKEIGRAPSPYLNAVLIARHLQREYEYGEDESLQTASGSADRPDPVDRFLFESRQGGSGSFSSAFVVLARSIGIPARVVAGWSILPFPGTQTVFLNQSHQWAEIALDGLGWITIDPTPGGPRSSYEGQTSLGGVTDEIAPTPPERVQDVESAVETLETSPSAQARAEASRELGEIGGAVALKALAAAFNEDPSQEVRDAAGDALENWDIDMLIRILREHEDPTTRAAAAHALGTLGDNKATAPLSVALTSDEAAEVRAASARALGRLRDPDGLEPLAGALSSDDVAEVRAEAARALGMLALTEVVPHLLNALTGDEDAEVRLGAAEALLLLTPRDAVEPLLVALGADPDAGVRSVAAEALGAIEDHRALQPLLQARESDTSAEVRDAAADALGQWSGFDLQEALDRADNFGSRAAAAQILGERGNIQSIPALSSALNDPVTEVRDAAREALTRFGVLVPLENGGMLLIRDEVEVAFIPGTTFERSTEVQRIPVFEVEGPAGINLLRTAVGDLHIDGRWMQQDTYRVDHSDVSRNVLALGVISGNGFGPDVRYEVSASVKPADAFELFLPGSLPIPERPGTLSVPGLFWPDSSTFATRDSTDVYVWNSEVVKHSDRQLNSAPGGQAYSFQRLPAGLPIRVHDLASEITSGHSTAHSKAVAIQEYLRETYTYGYAESQEDTGPPPGSDPVDWFLFDQQEGTSGNFSSAFVAMARSVGIAARVVSGWAINPADKVQTVYSDQAHQWAEVSLGGIGWVAIDPTPGGARYRAEPPLEQGSDEYLKYLREFVDDLSDPNKSVREAALKELNELGNVTQLENGGVIIGSGKGAGWMLGTTTRQSPGLLHAPVFHLTGAANTNYLRMAVGDVYEGGRWRQLDPVAIGPAGNVEVSQLVQSQLESANAEIRLQPASRLQPDLLAGFKTRPSSTRTDLLSLSPTGILEEVPRGPVPTSLTLYTIDVEGMILPFSSTYFAEESSTGYTWTSQVRDFAPSQLTAADASSDSTYTQLPPDLPERISRLATEITSGHDSTYEKALAISAYLATTYTYKLAKPSGEGSSPGEHDPVDWFLFERPEGTCGNFSSAFVVLARSVGVPSRVVSGWMVDATQSVQTVYADQAHQWAEVALEGIGWVTFEPTASGGAPTRVLGDVATARSGGSGGEGEGTGDHTGASGGDGDGESGGSGGDNGFNDQELGQLQGLVGALSDENASVRANALQALREFGDVTILENGGAIVGSGGRKRLFGGTSSEQASEPPHIPLFSVRGASNTGYLRTNVGDVYDGGRWQQLDPVTISPAGKATIPSLVQEQLEDATSDLAELPSSRRDVELLKGYQLRPAKVRTNRISLLPLPDLAVVTRGPIATSLTLQDVDVEGAFLPFSGTFVADESTTSGYSWTSWVPQFSDAQLHAAATISDATYTQLPPDVPDRVRRLAIEITANHATAYGKARALEQYLKTEYAYSYADPSGAGRTPPGHDPVDWFLFERVNGTCGNFSSAFVVMARSVGIPARVVSGWSIRPVREGQTVYSDQAHQWAEVAFEGIGWVTFEPTSSNGAPNRAAQFSEEADLLTQITDSDSGSGSGRYRPPVGPFDTITAITDWPAEVRRQQSFWVGGTVYSVQGRPALGMLVEVYVNETKEHGGIKIGSATNGRNGFRANVEMPQDIRRGGYQLLARAVPDTNYNESWSDPDIGVVAESGFHFSGPSEIPVDVKAIFEGRVAEESGEAIPWLEVSVTIDGQNMPSVFTDSAGHFDFTNAFAEPGRHWVEVSFRKTGFLLGNTARLELDVTLPTELSVESPSFVYIDEEFSVSGLLRDVRGNPLEDELVTLQVGDGALQSVRTNSAGEFEAQGSIEGAGDYTVFAEFSGAGFVLGSEATAPLGSRHVASLMLNGPQRILEGATTTLIGSFVSKTLSPIGELNVRLIDANGQPVAERVTNADGAFRYNQSPYHEPGPQVITVIFDGTDTIAPSEASFGFIVLTPTTLTIEGPSVVGVTEPYELEGLLLRLDGRPVTASNGRVQLAIEDSELGHLAIVTTASDGSFAYSHESLGMAGPHSISVRFNGIETFAPSDARLGVSVLYPTALTLDGPDIIVAGESFGVAGILRGPNGQPPPSGEQLKLIVEDAVGYELATVPVAPDGTYEYSHGSLDAAGSYSIRVRFAGTGDLAPSEASFAVAVLSPTQLTLSGPTLVQDGTAFELTGALRRGDGEPIPNVTIVTSSPTTPTVTTNASGIFAWQETLTLGGTTVESEMEIEAVFEGSDRFAPARAGVNMTVGKPWLVAEVPEPVARGDAIVLRGTVLIGSRSVPGVEVNVGDLGTAASDEAGRFSYRYEVPADAALGQDELTIEAPSLAAETTVPIEVKSSPNLLVTPLDRVRHGQTVRLQATLMNDDGDGISGAVVTSSQGPQAVTDASGVALLELTVPESQETQTVLVTFQYEGDDLNMPLTYFLGIPVIEPAINWWLRIGGPASLVGLLAIWYANRRLRLTRSLAALGRRFMATRPEMRLSVPRPFQPAARDVDAGLRRTRLEISAREIAGDLPEVWGIGEDVTLELRLTTGEEEAVAGSEVEVIADGQQLQTMTTDANGTCVITHAWDWPADFVLSARFGGSDGLQPSVASMDLRVVEFREEIVRLYNDFVDWARTQVDGIYDQTTPHEIERTLVDEGSPVDEEALDELVSRFEEADYSEHPISRRHYEAMLRAWRSVVEA